MTELHDLWWVYILRCKGNRYYTGYTNNLEKRYLSHVNGTGKCKFTRSFKPIEVAQSWEIKGAKARAMQIEAHIKKLSRVQKEKLIDHPDLLKMSFDSALISSPSPA